MTEQLIRNFIADSIILGIEDNIISHCVNIRREKKVKTPDAIIAGTALAYNYTLITSNEKTFTASAD